MSLLSFPWICVSNDPSGREGNRLRTSVGGSLRKSPTQLTKSFTTALVWEQGLVRSSSCDNGRRRKGGSPGRRRIHADKALLYRV